jgi:hypothetical protein
VLSCSLHQRSFHATSATPPPPPAAGPTAAHQAEAELDALRSELRAEQTALARRSAGVTAQAKEQAAAAAALQAEREGLVRAQALRGELAAKEARLRVEAEAAESQKEVGGT